MTVSDKSSAIVPSTASPRKRFHLDGRSVSLDPRQHAIRGDLADLALAECVFAPHYAQALAFQATSNAPIRVKPSGDADSTAALTPGDAFHVLDISNGWAWGHGDAPASVGYVEAASLARL